MISLGQSPGNFFSKSHGESFFASPEDLSFVFSVKEGDMVTIPFVNYHPVFSQKNPLEFV